MTGKRWIWAALALAAGAASAQAPAADSEPQRRAQAIEWARSRWQANQDQDPAVACSFAVEHYRTALPAEECGRLAAPEFYERQQAQRQQADQRAAALRAGATPTTFAEALIAHKAEAGGHLAGAPKLRPDGRLYGLVGRIDHPEGVRTIIIRTDPTTGAMPSAFNKAPLYSALAIPASLEGRLEGVQVGSQVRVIGRYVANIEYTTLAGERRLAPRFEVVYWE